MSDVLLHKIGFTGLTAICSLQRPCSAQHSAESDVCRALLAVCGRQTVSKVHVHRNGSCSSVHPARDQWQESEFVGCMPQVQALAGRYASDGHCDRYETV